MLLIGILMNIYLRYFQEDPYRILKSDIACLYGYSSRPQDCDAVKDKAQFFLNPLAAIIEAAKGTKWEDTREYQADKNAALETEVTMFKQESIPCTTN